jgi:hypothetical protein
MSTNSKLSLINGRLKTKSKKGYYYDTTDKQILSATVANMDFNAVVTFNTYQALSGDETAKLVGDFEKRLNERLFGKKWHRTGKKLIWAHFYENASSNAHSHSIVKFDDNSVNPTEFKRLARKVWAKLTKARLAHMAHNGREKACLFIDSGKRHGTKATANYITKKAQLF